MLFDDALGFITFSQDNGQDLFNKMIPNDKLVDIKEGFLRGNMFKDEYKPYKNMPYRKIVPQSKREEMLLHIMELSFAINDLNLYLDLHPQDESMLRKFRDLVEESCQKEMEFVKMFGPLELVDSDTGNSFKWIEDPWPWQNEKGEKYV